MSVMRWMGASLAVTLVALFTAGCGRAHNTVSNGVRCSSLQGEINFDPPLTNTGISSEMLSVEMHAEGCTTSGSKILHLTARAQGSISGGVNSCAGVLTSQPAIVHVVWAPNSEPASIVTFSGYDVATDSSGHEGFRLPGVRGSSRVMGSFTGGDGGGRSTALVISNETAEQILSACSSAGGLTSLQVTSGSFSLQ